MAKGTASAAPDLKPIEKVLAELAEYREIPREEFPGHKEIACTNLEGWLGSRVPVLLAEVKRLRQGLWDCAAAAGEDTDGNETPDHLAHPDIVEYALNAIHELRKDYDDGES